MTEFNEKYINELLIPFDSEFLIAYPNAKGYKFVEVYKIKTKTAIFDFGFCNKKKLNVTKVSWYRRRQNFYNDTIVMASLGTKSTEVSRILIRLLRVAKISYNYIFNHEIFFPAKMLK